MYFITSFRHTHPTDKRLEVIVIRSSSSGTDSNSKASSRLTQVTLTHLVSIITTARWCAVPNIKVCEVFVCLSAFEMRYYLTRNSSLCICCVWCDVETPRRYLTYWSRNAANYEFLFWCYLLIFFFFFCICVI